jgi:hypothetical protein
MRIPSIAIVLLFAGGYAVAEQPAPSAAVAANEKAPAGARVFFVEPKDGATVGADVQVRFRVEGIAIAPAAEGKAGTGHHHLLIDGKELPTLAAPIPNDATHKHYGKGQTEDTIHLDPGTHTLQLDFADARHVQFDPPIVSPKITVHVK